MLLKKSFSTVSVKLRPATMSAVTAAFLETGKKWLRFSRRPVG
jgi:hypothetical protein